MVDDGKRNPKTCNNIQGGKKKKIIIPTCKHTYTYVRMMGWCKFLGSSKKGLTRTILMFGNLWSEFEEMVRAKKVYNSPSL